ncbi:MAG: putative LPS assembly protein LptD, partial [Bacteroidales bacterium]|nr:putative LPS assembly protein LptD [Bacteroidales bacterium]
MTPEFFNNLTNIVLSILSRKSTIKFLGALFVLIITYNANAQHIIESDSLKSAQDSVTTDSVKIVPQNESDIKSPISYSAKDSMMFDLKTKMIYAYGEAKLGMDDMKLDAGYVIMNIDSNYLYAEAILDEKGVESGKPVFTQGGTEYKIKTIRYNFKSKKGMVTDVVTEQGGGFLHGGKTKMQPNKEIHLIDGKFTTCDADHPHFYIQLTKAKVVPEKKIVTGPFYFVISDIPLPLGLPFGYFPNQQNRTSGIIIPSYGEEKRRGFFLQQGGYYWAISDYVDLTVLGDIYTSGSWTINARSNYKKRYKFSGNFDINYQEVIQGEKNVDENYSKNSLFWVKLNYARDSKANPTSTFNASLNFGSSKSRSYNSNNPADFANNNASSSIAFTKTFPGTPFNFSANISATQNLTTGAVNLDLPTVAFNMNKQFPFKRKVAVGSKRWYEQISVGFSSNLKNSINIGDSLLFTEEALKRFENGFQYKIPINTSIKVLKYLNLSPSISYNGRIYTNSLIQRPLYLNDSLTNTYADTITGFGHVYDFAFSAPLGTKLYGKLNFKKGKIAAIRHVMSPSIGFSYRPDFGQPEWGFYEQNLNPEDPNRFFSTYGNGVYGTAPLGKSGNVNFSLGNNFEMKTHSKDTTEEFKKIVLLNSLNFGTSYNIAADSLNWAPLTISANTKLLKQINVTYSSSVDLYKIDPATGRTINELYLSKDNVLGHMTRSSVTLSGSINSDTFKKKGKKENETENSNTGTDENNTGLEGLNGMPKKGTKNQSEQETPVGEYNFKIPWNLSINYSYSYSSTKFDTKTQEWEPTITQTANLNGSLSLTQKWKFSGSLSYD